MSVDEKTYAGQCYCGAVAIQVTGEPEGAGYCRCKNAGAGRPARSTRSRSGSRRRSG
jgi:hypothetical protein